MTRIRLDNLRLERFARKKKGERDRAQMTHNGSSPGTLQGGREAIQAGK